MSCEVCSAPAGDECPAWCRFESGLQACEDSRDCCTLSLEMNGELCPDCEGFDSRSSGPASCAGCDEELNDEAVEIGLILCPDCLTCQINIAFANPELAGVDE